MDSSGLVGAGQNLLSVACATLNADLAGRIADLRAPVGACAPPNAGSGRFESKKKAALLRP